MAFDKFGFPQGIRTPAMLQDIENATQQVQNLIEHWTKDGFGAAEIEEFTNSSCSSGSSEVDTDSDLGMDDSNSDEDDEINM